MTRLSEFEQLYAANYDAVARYVFRRVPSEAVHDVVAETFLTAWRRFGDLRGEPLPWLLGIARRASANQLRGTNRRVALAERLAAEAPPNEQPSHDRGLLEALASLSEADREALMLVAWDGLGNGEAAAVVGCSATAFAVRLHRARRRLERALGREPDASIEIANEASVHP